MRNNVLWRWFLWLSGYNWMSMKSLGRFPWNPREVLVVNSTENFLRAASWSGVIGMHFSQGS